MRCRYKFPNGIRCKNDCQSGYCLGHPPRGGNRAAWVSAIAATISAVNATITGAWPLLEPIIRIWLQNHADFMTRSETLLHEVMDTEDFADDLSIQEQEAVELHRAVIQDRIDDLVKEAAELHQAVYEPSKALIPAKARNQTAGSKEE